MSGAGEGPYYMGLLLVESSYQLLKIYEDTRQCKDHKRLADWLAKIPQAGVKLPVSYDLVRAFFCHCENFARVC